METHVDCIPLERGVYTIRLRASLSRFFFAKKRASLRVNSIENDFLN